MFGRDLGLNPGTTVLLPLLRGWCLVGPFRCIFTEIFLAIEELLEHSWHFSLLWPLPGHLKNKKVYTTRSFTDQNDGTIYCPVIYSRPNHRTAEWFRLEGTTSSGSSGPSSQLQQGHPREQAIGLKVLESLQWRQTPQPLEQSVPVLGHCTGMKFFLMFRWKSLCISFFQLSLLLLFSTTKQNLAPASWHPPSRYW